MAVVPRGAVLSPAQLHVVVREREPAKAGVPLARLGSRHSVLVRLDRAGIEPTAEVGPVRGGREADLVMHPRRQCHGPVGFDLMLQRRDFLPGGSPGGSLQEARGGRAGRDVAAAPGLEVVAVVRRPKRGEGELAEVLARLPLVVVEDEVDRADVRGGVAGHLDVRDVSPRGALPVVIAVVGDVTPGDGDEHLPLLVVHAGDRAQIARDGDGRDEDVLPLLVSATFRQLGEAEGCEVPIGAGELERVGVGPLVAFGGTDVGAEEGDEEKERRRTCPHRRRR
mmetsp:Transcript_49221/g.104660  ORF Transcript_49221/g.104660 Transcript_49221/m.104660 type:complete len:281 (-) Transcript_49221:87-929(-)